MIGKPTLFELERRDCPAPVFHLPSITPAAIAQQLFKVYGLPGGGDGVTVAIPSEGRVSLPGVKVLYPDGIPEKASPGWTDEVRTAVKEIQFLAPRARVVSIQIPASFDFDYMGQCARAGKVAQVVCVLGDLSETLPDLGLFDTGYPWQKYAHPPTVYVAAVGDAPPLRSPANYRGVLSVGATFENDQARGVSEDHRVPDVVAVGESLNPRVHHSSAAAIIWAAVAADVIAETGRHDSEWLRSFIAHHPHDMLRYPGQGFGEPIAPWLAKDATPGRHSYPWEP